MNEAVETYNYEFTYVQEVVRSIRRLKQAMRMKNTDPLRVEMRCGPNLGERLTPAMILVRGLARCPNVVLVGEAAFLGIEDFPCYCGDERLACGIHVSAYTTDAGLEAMLDRFPAKAARGKPVSDR